MTSPPRCIYTGAGCLLQVSFSILCNGGLIAGGILVFLCGAVIFPAAVWTDEMIIQGFFSADGAVDDSEAKFPVFPGRTQIKGCGWLCHGIAPPMC